ncbi:unnamed protein product [Sphenostylis stenocarpa]|uniref:Uncharacterized protein n=1 Tax=Sphenostylis stenocarpa TaxID=92480 RepID=A0AA86SWB4_9FABA|nr:unnamed protein product [Sphenostylis stenocarpa]
MDLKRISFEIKICRRKEQDLFDAMGLMHAGVTFIGVVNGASVQPKVAIERTVFYREGGAECIQLTICYFTSTTTIQLENSYHHLCREYPYGGDGATGFALLHGPCKNWWLPNMEMTCTNLRMVKELKNLYLGIEREIKEESESERWWHAWMPEMAGTRKRKKSEIWKKKALNWKYVA